MPLLAIEPLVTGQPAAPAWRSRIVVLTTPSERVQHLALVSLEVPQLSLLKREMLKASDEVDCPPGMLRAVRIGGDQDAFIPDFDLLRGTRAARHLPRLSGSFRHRDPAPEADPDACRRGQRPFPARLPYQTLPPIAGYQGR